MNMNFDFVAAVVGLLLIPFLNGYKEISPLLNPQYFNKVLIVCIALAIVALCNLGYVNKFRVPNNPYLLLFCPLYALTLYRVMCLWFRKMHGRDPLNYWREWAPEKRPDNNFQTCYVVLAVGAPIGLLGLYYP